MGEFTRIDDIKILREIIVKAAPIYYITITERIDSYAVTNRITEANIKEHIGSVLNYFNKQRLYYKPEDLL